MLTRKDLARHRALASRHLHWRWSKLAGRVALASALAVAGIACATTIVPQAAAASTVTFTQLKLINGWHTDAGFHAPAVVKMSGIVTFKGDIYTDGTNPEPFVLPTGFRPATRVFVAAALCGANKGRLYIQPTGVVEVQAETSFSKAACVTSLDGVSFATSATSFTKLKLLNGWLNAPYGTSAAAVRLISGVVHFKGAIRTKGSSDLPFTMPTGFRPKATVYLPVDLCNASKGRLIIRPTGVVELDAENSFSDATCFTSLDGATFAISSSSFTALTLANGWRYYGFGTYKPAVRMSSGIVRFEGAIRKGTSGTLFTLPKGMRPAKEVYVEVDLCNANNGRLYIQPNGVVEVYEEGGVFSHATCFTSLDGAWFAR